MSIAEGLGGIYEDPSLLSRPNTWNQEQKFILQGSGSYSAINWNGTINVGIYNPNNDLFYGIFPVLPAPAGATGLGGYYNGVGISGSSNYTATPIFGVLNNAQSTNGIGHTALTVYDDNTIESFYVQIGAEPVLSTPTIVSGTIYQNTTNS